MFNNSESNEKNFIDLSYSLILRLLLVQWYACPSSYSKGFSPVLWPCFSNFRSNRNLKIHKFRSNFLRLQLGVLLIYFVSAWKLWSCFESFYSTRFLNGSLLRMKQMWYLIHHGIIDNLTILFNFLVISSFHFLCAWKQCNFFK